MMQRWVSEIHPTQEPGLHNLAESIPGMGETIDDSDSEAELDAEILQLQLQKGKQALQSGNSTRAEIFLKPGISRLKAHRSRYLDVERKLYILQEVLDTYQQREQWQDVKHILMERISIISSGGLGDSERYLEETVQLVKILLKLGELDEAQTIARKCIKAYRKLGSKGQAGLHNSLRLMISACELDGDEAEAEVYTAMLMTLRGSVEKDTQE